MKRRRKSGVRRARTKRPPRRKLPRPGKRTLLATLGLIAAGGAAFAARVGWEWLVHHPELIVRTVEVRGAQEISQEQVLQLAEIPEDASWAGLDRKAVELRVRREPRVHRARVRRTWPGRVRIDVDECSAWARVDVRGRDYGLCRHVQLFPMPDDDGALPRIVEPELTPEELSRGLDYLASLREQGVDGTRARVTLQPAGRDEIRLPQPGLRLEVDRSVPPGVAVGRLAAFLESLDAKGAVQGTLRVISGKTAVWRAA